MTGGPWCTENGEATSPWFGSTGAGPGIKNPVPPPNPPPMLGEAAVAGIGGGSVGCDGDAPELAAVKKYTLRANIFFEN